MSETASAPARGTLTVRGGSSRQLLQRKQAERAGQSQAPGGGIEDAFPSAEPAASPSPAAQALASPQEPESAPPSAAQRAAPAQPPAAPAWSSEDESAFQAMAARRKASGFQRRGKDVSAQLIRAGDIRPNDGTVMAQIVGIVAERGTVARGELLDAMAKAAWSNAKAAANRCGGRAKPARRAVARRRRLVR